MGIQWEFLKKSFDAKKHSHAYIFFGNDAKEKQQVIQKLVAYLNKSDAITLEAIEENRLPDVKFIKPEAQEITIAQMRDLSQFASLGAWSAPFKIAILEGAEKANQEAQSAFLKLLEEPKGNIIFLLLADYRFLLLPTIASRALAIGFWKFGALKSSMEKEFEKLETQTLAERFAYAKDLAESDDNNSITEVLQEFLAYLRNSVLSALKEPAANVSSKLNALRRTQEILHLLQTTNVNKRLAIEQFMLEF